MFIQQIYTGCLAQASYYIESEGEASVIDPMREAAPYLGIAARNGARIRYIFETHFHADFISGHLDLAEETQATIVFGPNARPAYHAYVAAQNEVFHLGACTLKLLHTPGHTIESSCFLLYDENGIEHAVFTGDTLFVNDAGRPDLMSGGKSKEELASMLFDSLHQVLLQLPPHVIVYPGHGAGSACGRHLGAERQSTIGDEMRKNSALQPMTRSEFISMATTGLPPAPNYFFQSASTNIIGPRRLTDVMASANKGLSVFQVKRLLKQGAIVLDTRRWTIFHEGFIPGALHIGLRGNFAPWAGTLINTETRLIIVCEPGTEEETITRLARVGFENVAGFLDGGFEAWFDSGETCDTVEMIPPDQLQQWMSSGDYVFVDVRRPAETALGSVPGAVLRPLEDFPHSIDTFDSHRKYILFCQSGYRAMIAASLLKAHGIDNVHCLNGGYAQIGNSKNSMPEPSACEV